jgi:hypothetical protein
MWHVWDRKEYHRVFWFENLTRRNCLEDISVDERIILR